MNCNDLEERDMPELYLLGRLTESERDEFEQHYFECESCFAQLQTGLMMQAELRREPLARGKAGATLLSRIWAWTPAFVVVGLLLAVSFWWYSARRESSQRASVPPVKANPEAIGQSPSRAAPSLEELARVEAPPYTGVVLRSAEDEGEEAFRNAMQYYEKGDYAHAIRGLRAAVKASPRTAKFHFYLGICYLLTDQTDGAEESFKKTVSLGDPAYSGPAHFYLAKAYLRKKDVSAAENELQESIRLRGGMEAEAGEVLRWLQN